MTTIKTDPPPLSFADHGTTPYTSGPNIMHRDHSAWVREAVGEAGRVRAALLPPFWSINRRVGVVVPRSRSTMVLSRGVLGKLQTPRSLQHLKTRQSTANEEGGVFGIVGAVLRPRPRTQQTLGRSHQMAVGGAPSAYLFPSLRFLLCANTIPFLFPSASLFANDTLCPDDDSSVTSLWSAGSPAASTQKQLT